MTTTSVYRSTHPDVVAWWEKMHADRVEFDRRCHEVMERFPGFTAIVLERRKGMTLSGIVGHEGEGFDKRLLPPPSPAWRRVHGDITHYKPYRNHLKDPELVRLFNGEISWKMDFPPGGMPLEILADNKWFWPGMKRDETDDQAIWFSWGVGHDWIDPDPDLEVRISMRQSPDDHVDLDLWQHAKLSEFFAASGN